MHLSPKPIKRLFAHIRVDSKGCSLYAKVWIIEWNAFDISQNISNVSAQHKFSKYVQSMAYSSRGASNVALKFRCSHLDEIYAINHTKSCQIDKFGAAGNENVHMSVLNGELWGMEQVHSGICELGQLWPQGENATFNAIIASRAFRESTHYAKM